MRTRPIHKNTRNIITGDRVVTLDGEYGYVTRVTGTPSEGSSAAPSRNCFVEFDLSKETHEYNSDYLRIVNE